MLKRSCMRVARFIKYRRQLNASTDQRRMTIDSELSGVDGSVVDVITAVKHLALTLFVDVFAARLLAIECNVRSRHSLSSATIASLSMKPAENSCLTSVTETAYTARFVVNNCSPSLVVRAVPSTRVLENLKKTTIRQCLRLLIDELSCKVWILQVTASLDKDFWNIPGIFWRISNSCCITN